MENPKVDWFFDKNSKWQEAYRKLRIIVLDCGLTEELKWGVPCYQYQGSNLVLIHGFKNYCALLFHKGVLLQDSEAILVQQTENVQAARQLRFSNLDDISNHEKAIKAYIFEAIEVEKIGLKIPMKKTKEFNIPEEFRKQSDKFPALKTAFENLSPGRQRAYLLYFSAAKQSKTRTARIEKYSPKILAGKGLED